MQVIKLSNEKEGQAEFYRFECNSENKALGKELNIKTVPTFIFYKAGEEVARCVLLTAYLHCEQHPACHVFVKPLGPTAKYSRLLFYVSLRCNRMSGAKLETLKNLVEEHV